MKNSKYRYVIWLLIPLSFILLLSILTSDGISMKNLEMALGITTGTLSGIQPYTLYGAFFFFFFLIRWMIQKKPIQSSQRRKVIVAIIERLIKKFPVRPKPYQIPVHIHMALQNNPHDEHAIAALLFDIHSFLGMDTSNLRYEICYIHDYDTENSEDKQNPAGYYMDCGDGTRKITLYLRKSYNLYTVTSIVAHETMHHFLEKHKMKYTNIEENELLTDIAALYLGFEEYMVKGNTELYDGGNRFISVGYLSKSEIQFVIQKITHLC